MRPVGRDFLHHHGMLALLYGLLCVLVALLVIPTWGWTYWDFGDGNYMYIARRVSEGLVLYRDILAPQPPLHTLAGVVVEVAGDTLFNSRLTGVRLYGLLVRLLGGLLVLLIARRFFGCPFRAITAAAVYLFMPIGFWWSLGYQSENLEIVFLLAALLFLLPWKPRHAAIAGVFSALACHCNMTALPFLLANALFLVFRRPKLLAWYLGAAAGVYTVIAIGATIWTDGHFLSNVLFNQAGTFPDTNILRASNPEDSFWKYAWRKITTEGGKVLELEGGLIAAAIVGSLLALRRSPSPEEGPGEKDRWHRSEFLSWQLIAGFLSICFTAKGGTVNYIFVLGEPMVALFAAEAFVSMWRFFVPGEKEEWKALSIWNTGPFLRLFFPLLVLGIIYVPVVQNIRLSLNEVQAELPEDRVLELKSFIHSYAAPGDVILAPPFYAFLTDTNVAGELAENYIWQIKFMNEQFYAREGEASEKMAEIAEMLRNKEVSVVLLDLAQTGRVPMISEAVAEHYKPAEPEPYQTRNTQLGLYVPEDVTLRHRPLNE